MKKIIQILLSLLFVSSVALAQLSAPPINSTFPVSVIGPSGESLIFGVNSETITLNTGGTTTDSVANLLPARSFLLGVECKIVTTITTATTWKVETATSAARFCLAQSTLTAGFSVDCAEASVAFDTYQFAADKLRITTDVNPGAGAVKCSVIYMHPTTIP